MELDRIQRRKDDIYRKEMLEKIRKQNCERFGKEVLLNSFLLKFSKVCPT